MTLLLSTLAAIATLAVEVRPTPPPACRGVRLHVENDMMTFSGSDRSYTNGIRLDAVGCSTHLWHSLARKRALGLLRPDSDEVDGFAVGYVVGHSLYTPRSISQPTILEDDRPYAAWLYAGTFMKFWDSKRLDHLEVNVGALGPQALGYEIQTRWHQAVGSPLPQGWAHQTGGAAAILVRYVQTRELLAWPAAPQGGDGRAGGSGPIESEGPPMPPDGPPSDGPPSGGPAIGEAPPQEAPPRYFDLNGEVEVRAGNVFDTMGVGVAARAGWIRTNFGPAPTIAAFPGRPPATTFELYGFVRAAARVVAWNATIGGTLGVEDDHTMRAGWLVTDGEVGGELAVGPVRVATSLVFRSTELAADGWRPDAHRYVQIQLAYHPDMR